MTAVRVAVCALILAIVGLPRIAKPPSANTWSREIDNRVFKYVGVAGIDKPRIVQVGVSAEHLPACR